MVEAGNVQAIEFTVNGERREATVASRQLLVHFLRDSLGMKGTHIGCDTGSCGACSVIVDGRLVKSCMMLAPQADGCEIETIEGIAKDGELTAVQRAFHEEHGLQCGYCTPGLVMAATFLLRRNPQPSEDEIRRAVRGNICRCTGYVNIIRSIERAARNGAEEAA
ncbi:MAG: (2Fe-2S)-binding protein [Solirubrobacterales bacterium]|nr:(2Fe-2S)-binding protein [Solirubrobacterales bacterium]MBV9715934.1 (2Fe-2S)-binding protein [Solirubrobacterales bacterium]